MDERKSQVNFELSQDVLGSAWQDLAEAIVLRSDTPVLLRGGSSPDGKRQPYQFTVELSEVIMQEALLCTGDIPLKAEAQYLMEYRPADDPDDPNTYEAVMVEWEYELPERAEVNKVKVTQNLMIIKTRNGAEEYLEGGLFFEYSELQNGAWQLIRNSGHESKLLSGDVETLHRVAQYIREQS